MPSWMAWVQIPSGLIKMEGSASTFNGLMDAKINLNPYQIIKASPEGMYVFSGLQGLCLTSLIGLTYYALPVTNHVK